MILSRFSFKYVPEKFEQDEDETEEMKLTNKENS